MILRIGPPFRRFVKIDRYETHEMFAPLSNKVSVPAPISEEAVSEIVTRMTSSSKVYLSLLGDDSFDFHGFVEE